MNEPQQDRRAERAVQLILEACAAQQYVAPFDVVVTDQRGTRIAARIDHEAAVQLEGDISSVGLMSSPFIVSVMDSGGECAEFRVELLDTDDGRALPPIISYPSSWIRLTRGNLQ